MYKRQVLQKAQEFVRSTSDIRTPRTIRDFEREYLSDRSISIQEAAPYLSTFISSPALDAEGAAFATLFYQLRSANEEARGCLTAGVPGLSFTPGDTSAAAIFAAAKHLADNGIVDLSNYEMKGFQQIVSLGAAIRVFGSALIQLVTIQDLRGLQYGSDPLVIPKLILSKLDVNANPGLYRVLEGRITSLERGMQAETALYERSQRGEQERFGLGRLWGAIGQFITYLKNVNVQRQTDIGNIDMNFFREVSNCLGNGSAVIPALLMAFSPNLTIEESQNATRIFERIGGIDSNIAQKITLRELVGMARGTVNFPAYLSERSSNYRDAIAEVRQAGNNVTLDKLQDICTRYRFDGRDAIPLLTDITESIAGRMSGIISAMEQRGVRLEIIGSINIWSLHRFASQRDNSRNYLNIDIATTKFSAHIAITERMTTEQTRDVTVANPDGTTRTEKKTVRVYNDDVTRDNIDQIAAEFGFKDVVEGRNAILTERADDLATAINQRRAQLRAENPNMPGLPAIQPAAVARSLIATAACVPATTKLSIVINAVVNSELTNAMDSVNKSIMPAGAQTNIAQQAAAQARQAPAAQAAPRVGVSGIIITLGENVRNSDGIGARLGEHLDGLFTALSEQLDKGLAAKAADTARQIQRSLSGARFDNNLTVIATRAVMQAISNRAVGASDVINTLGEELAKAARTARDSQLEADVKIQFATLADRLAANDLQGAILMLGHMMDAQYNADLSAAINANPAVLAALNNIAEQVEAQDIDSGVNRQAAAVRTQIAMMRAGMAGNVTARTVDLGTRFGNGTVSAAEASRASGRIETDLNGAAKQDAVMRMKMVMDNMIAAGGARTVLAAGRQMTAEAKAAGVGQAKISKLNSAVNNLAQAVKAGDASAANMALAQVEKALRAGNVAVNGAMTRCRDIVASMKQSDTNMQVQATVAVQEALHQVEEGKAIGAVIVVLSTELGTQEITPENTRRARETYNGIVGRLNGAATSQALAPTLALLDTVIAARETRVTARQQVNAVALAAASQGRPMSQQQKTNLENRMLAANSGITIKDMVYVLNINGVSVPLKEKTDGASLVGRINSNRKEIARRAGVDVSVVDAMVRSMITRTGGSYEVSLGETVGESGKAVFDFDASGNLTQTGTTRTYRTGVQEAVDIHTGHEGLTLPECVGDIAAMIKKAQITGTPLAQMTSYILAKDGRIGELRFDTGRKQFTLRVAPVGGEFGKAQPFTDNILGVEVAAAVSAAIGAIDIATGKVAAASTDLPTEAGKTTTLDPVTITRVSETGQPAVFELRVNRAVAAPREAKTPTPLSKTTTAPSGGVVSTSVFTGRAGPPSGGIAGRAANMSEAQRDQADKALREEASKLGEQLPGANTGINPTGTIQPGVGMATIAPPVNLVIIEINAGTRAQEAAKSVADKLKEGVGISAPTTARIEVVDAAVPTNGVAIEGIARILIKASENPGEVVADMRKQRDDLSRQGYKEFEFIVVLDANRPKFEDFVEAFSRYSEALKDKVIVMIADSSIDYGNALAIYAKYLDSVKQGGHAAAGASTVVFTRTAVVKLAALAAAGRIELNPAAAVAVAAQTNEGMESAIEAELAY